MNRKAQWLVLILAAMLMLIGVSNAYAHDHIYVWTVEKAATCTASGVEKGVCSICSEEAYRPIPLAAHDWKLVEKQPTCTNAGVKEEVCSVCKAKRNTVVIPATGHNWGQYVIIMPAACTATGIEERICQNCQQKQTRPVAATGHNWGYFTQTKAPGCTEPGLEESICQNCQQKWTRAIPATGHNWGPYQTTLPAGCTTPGVSVSLCQNNCGQQRTRVLAALGHNWGQPVVTVPATCTHTGTAVTDCQRCGTQYTTVLPVINHIYGDWTVSVAPTCTTRGTDVRACTMCGRQETRRTKALGHTSDGVWITVRQPSLKERGLQATTCTVCGGQAKRRTFAPRGYQYEVPAYAFGPWAVQVDPALSAVRERLIPIDMTVDGRQSFPLITEDGYNIGAALVTVSGGSLTVTLEKASEPTLLRYRTFLLYQGPEDTLRYRPEGDTLPFDLPVKVEGGRALLSIKTTANYYQGNENKTFHEAMMSPDGAHSYLELAQQMVGEIARMWAAQ